EPHRRKRDHEREHGKQQEPPAERAVRSEARGPERTGAGKQELNGDAGGDQRREHTLGGTSPGHLSSPPRPEKRRRAGGEPAVAAATSSSGQTVRPPRARAARGSRWRRTG